MRHECAVLDEELAHHAGVRAEDLRLERRLDHLEARGAGEIGGEVAVGAEQLAPAASTSMPARSWRVANTSRRTPRPAMLGSFGASAAGGRLGPAPWWGSRV